MKLRYFGTWAVLAASVASAQDIPAQQIKDDMGAFNVASDRSCIHGHNPFANGTTERVRKLAEENLAKYISLAGKAAGADVSGAYTTKTTTLGWEVNRTKYRKIVRSWSIDGHEHDITSVNDSLAQALFLAPNPADRYLKVDKFFIAGAKLNAMGLWRIVNPANADETIGWYKARFMRQNRLDGQSWDLISLEVSHEKISPFSIQQFCFEPGDVQANWAWEQQKKADRESRKAQATR